MTQLLPLIVLLLLTSAAQTVAAQPAAPSAQNCVTDIRGNQICGNRPGQCVLDRYRAAWCAPANGQALQDRYGEIVCGAGVCTTDLNGNIQCASTAGGSISTSPSNQLTCAGGCVLASQSICQRITPQ